MVEIGAGSGVLTAALAEVVRGVRAIEVDPWHASKLRRRFEGIDGVEVVEADFFATELPRERYSVFANVPFNRTADVVRRLTEGRSQPEDAYLVVQSEAAARFAGRPYGMESVASLQLKPWWHLEIEHWFRRGDFEPPPRVEAVMLHLGRRARPLLDPGERGGFGEFVARSFGRGSVGRGLRGYFAPGELRLLARRLRFERGASPSELGFEQWLAMYRQQGGGAAANGRGRGGRVR